MNGKKILLVLTVMAFATAAFADDSAPRGRGPWNRAQRSNRDSWQMEGETFQGTLRLQSEDPPSLVTSDGTVYTLIVPFPIDQEDLPVSGARLVVEGVEMPMHSYDWLGEERHLMVFSIEANGKTLEPDSSRRWGKFGKGGFFRGGCGRSRRW